MIYFDYKIPEIRDRSKLHYIEDRLGLSFTDDDFSKMKVIPSLYDFLCMNKIKYRPFNDYILKLLQLFYIFGTLFLFLAHRFILARYFYFGTDEHGFF